MSTEVVKAPQYGVSTEVDYGSDAGLGTQGIDQSHYSPPMLNVLQDLSPTVKSRQHNAGDIHNTGSGEVFDGASGVEIVPCAVDHYYTEWKPRSEGGGFLGRHEAGSPVVAQALAQSTEFGKYNTPRGTLAETFVVYGLMLHNGDWEHVVVPFTSTKIKLYKKFIAKIMAVRVNGKKPPLFAHAFRFKTKTETSPKGSFSNWDIGFAGGSAEQSRLDAASPLYSAAREFALAAIDGSVKTNDTQEVPF